MYQTRENLDIIFRKRTPEDVLEGVRSFYKGNSRTTFPYEMCSFELYDYYGMFNLTGYSGDEIRMRFDEMNNRGKHSGYSIYALLYEYADDVLEYRNQEPLCKIESILNWNSITSRLGQDIFVTAWLAKCDYEQFANGGDCLHVFNWPYCIRTNDVRLNKLFESGLAENHFHLGGSTQAFPISWAALMNHPKIIYKTIRDSGRFKKNLMQGRTDFSDKNEARWTILLRYAAYIRALLFERCIGNISSGEMIDSFIYYDCMLDNSEVIDRVGRLRMLYGTKVHQPNGEEKCLDYTMSTRLYRTDLNGYNRLLAGERAFLYSCFSEIYKKIFGVFEKSLFYLYLLIKSNFRSELVQVNKRNGFYNFQQYQNRKEQFYPYAEYRAEAQRLAICSSISENHITSLEARMMPARTAGAIARKICNSDRLVKFACEKDRNKIFYVLHFAKQPYIKKEVVEIKEGLLRPRNWKVRNLIRHQARAIYTFRLNYCGVTDKNEENLQSRLHGIDACSSEIGCRPETFATEFRFLRSSNVVLDSKWHLHNSNIRKDLGITYHVGEDFLDICDGLRAVDEAIEFLELRNGDRIGHGLVLGLNPDQYYSGRYDNIYLTKQDYLDNCIWILFRTLEWDIELSSAEREFLKQEACRVAGEIYGIIDPGRNADCLEALYRSWHLRGDHPDLYRSGDYCPDEEYTVYSYNLYREGNRKKELYRKDPYVAKLYYLYHFDQKVKMRGLDVIPIPISSWYVELMKKLQEHIRCNRIAKNGIAIECNPTSNKSIGYFDTYDQHPILQFNDYTLNPFSKRQQIAVCINTDDLGVFDTSLSYEYALLFCAIRRKRHKEENYNDEQIYEYLHYIIANGFKLSF